MKNSEHSLSQVGRALRSAPSFKALCHLPLAIAMALLLSGASAFAQPVVPLVHAHAHNDYQHTRPLLDALDCGLCSVEADVHLVDGQLLVGHARFQTRPGRTLQSLYLDPLHERVKQNGGKVYPGGPEFTLLVELKDDWQTSYSTLRKILQNYADMLTTYEDGKKQPKAITVIITGNRAREMFAGEKVRYAALDGDLPDLNTEASADLVPWISSQWSQHFKWRGAGTMPEAEQAKLQSIVTKAHQQGRRVRFWGAPDKPAFWTALRASQVDLINTDDLEGVKRFLLAEPKATSNLKQADGH
jgi:hypothetical protein